MTPVKIFIVTVKEPRNPDHDPHNKQVGKCRFSEYCTDVTGQHHSLLVSAPDEADVRAQFSKTQITRIEEVVGADPGHVHERDHTTHLEPGAYSIANMTDVPLPIYWEVCICGARRLFGNHPFGEWQEATP